MATTPKDDTKGAAAADRAAGPAAGAAGTTASVRYIDQLDVTETFADSINNVYFDGQSLRIEFGITRLDDIKPNAAVTGRRYPAQRMVLTPMAAVARTAGNENWNRTARTAGEHMWSCRAQSSN